MHSVSSYVDSPEFHEPGAETSIMVPIPEVQYGYISEADDWYRKLMNARPLTAEQQRDCFRMMNYLKFRASTASDRRESEQLLAEALQVRQILAMTSQRLIHFAIGRKVNFLRVSRPDVFGEWVSQASEALLRAIDLFNYSGGFQFSTWAIVIMRRGNCVHWNRIKRFSERARQFGEYDDGSGEIDYVESRELDPLSAAGQAESAARVAKLLRCLSGRHRELIESLFGINGAPPQSAEQIADNMNISRGRVVQLKEFALQRLRSAVEKKAAM